MYAIITLIFITFSIILGYVCWNLLKKVEAYEETIKDYETHLLDFQEYYKQLVEAIQYSDLRIKQIDARGSFKSDDEIGYFFKLIQDLQILLNSFDYTSPQIKPEEQLPTEKAIIK